MTPAGFAAGICHMVFHAFMKICSFFCAGAVMHQSERHYIHQLDGFARQMPKVFAVFTAASFALMGVPGLCGFVSKWNLADAAIASGNVMAYVGVGALLVSALLTAMYMLGIVVRAYFPKADFDYGTVADVRDPNWMMLAPLLVFVVCIVGFGVCSVPFTELFAAVARGGF